MCLEVQEGYHVMTLPSGRIENGTLGDVSMVPHNLWIPPSQFHGKVGSFLLSSAWTLLLCSSTLSSCTVYKRRFERGYASPFLASWRLH